MGGDVPGDQLDAACGSVDRTLLGKLLLQVSALGVAQARSDLVEPAVDRLFVDRQLGQLQEFLQSVDNVVVDIGASNVEELLKLMRRYQDSQEDFDGFIVPTVPARKQQQDTAATLAELARIGVPPDRLRVVFNQVDDDIPIDRTFETLLAYCSTTGVVHPSLAAFLSFNEVYALVRGSGQSLTELAADRTDYKALIGKAQPQADKLALAHCLAVQRLARGVVPELDACFAALELHRLPSGQQATPAA